MKAVQVDYMRFHEMSRENRISKSAQYFFINKYINKLWKTLQNWKCETMLK